MNKLGPKFNWRIADGIMLREDATTYAVAGFQDRDFKPGLGKFNRGR